MEPATTMRCVNCGMTLEMVSDAGQGTMRCSVCEFPFDVETMDTQPLIVSVNDLEAQLDTLLAAARAGDISAEDILRTLRDELEFAAELAQPGRHLSVQILDLGPREGVPMSRQAPQQRAPLNSRAVGS